MPKTYPNIHADTKFLDGLTLGFPRQGISQLDRIALSRIEHPSHTLLNSDRYKKTQRTILKLGIGTFVVATLASLYSLIPQPKYLDSKDYEKARWIQTNVPSSHLDECWRKEGSPLARNTFVDEVEKRNHGEYSGEKFFIPDINQDNIVCYKLN